MIIPEEEDSVSLCLFNLMALPHFLGTEAVILVPSAQSLKIKNLLVKESGSIVLFHQVLLSSFQAFRMSPIKGMELFF